MYLHTGGAVFSLPLPRMLRQRQGAKRLGIRNLCKICSLWARTQAVPVCIRTGRQDAKKGKEKKMKVPKRLPKSFAEALATAKRRGEVVLEVKMIRYHGRALFQAKTASDYNFRTIECLLYVLRGRSIREETRVHYRSWPVIEKALAVRDAQLKAWAVSDEDADWMEGVGEDASKAL